jgi:hypothetical protein
MTQLCGRWFLKLAFVGAALIAVPSAAGPIYVVSRPANAQGTGTIYRYDDLADLAAQTPSTITGTVVRNLNQYRLDQGATFDFGRGLVFRINEAGDVLQYESVENWINNTSPVSVSIGTNPFSFVDPSNKRVNDMSFDGATGGFYAVGAPAADSTTPGDILIYNTLDDMRAAAHNNAPIDSPYNAARVMFWTREKWAGTTVNSQNIKAQYFQISGAGRLEGFKSLAQYAATPNNRINLGLEGAFGGTNTTNFQAILAFAVPEPASVILCVAGAMALLGVRRR